MAKQTLDQETQVGKSDVYGDERTPGIALQNDAFNLRDDLNALRTQLRQVIHGLGSGHWYDDPANVFGGDASLKALYYRPGGGVTPGDHGYRHDITGPDPVGVSQFVVPAAVSLRDLVCTVGPYAADWADNSIPGMSPIVGIVVSKPSSTLAFVAYFGVVTGFTGLIPGSGLFLGTSGGIISPPLPSTVGTVIQRIGQAITDTVLLLDPEQPIVL